MLTLTRGESGDNALGPELFDALGLIRTEELLLADRYYGVDRQYFGTVVDYGFSKRLDETLEKWGIDHVLRDIVGVIRTERPLVVIARFQGNERDGHGNHSAAGMVTQEAFDKAADPTVFPDQTGEGTQTVAAAEAVHGRRACQRGLDHPGRRRAATIRSSASRISRFARRGLSFQRSQNGGRVLGGARAGAVLLQTAAFDRSGARRKNSRSSTASTSRFRASTGHSARRLRPAASTR